MNEPHESSRPDLSDLVRKYLQGDAQAGEQLGQLLVPVITVEVKRRLNARYWDLVPDICQDVWVRFLNGLHNYRGDGLLTYIRTISHGATVDATRILRARSKEKLIEVDVSQPTPHASVVNLEAAQAEVDRVRQAAAQILDPKLLQVLELRLQDLTFEQIGLEMQMSGSWVRLAWGRILRMLR